MAGPKNTQLLANIQRSCCVCSLLALSMYYNPFTHNLMTGAKLFELSLLLRTGTIYMYMSTHTYREESSSEDESEAEDQPQQQQPVTSTTASQPSATTPVAMATPVPSSLTTPLSQQQQQAPQLQTPESKASPIAKDGGGSSGAATPAQDTTPSEWG